MKKAKSVEIHTRNTKVMKTATEMKKRTRTLSCASKIYTRTHEKCYFHFTNEAPIFFLDSLPLILALSIASVFTYDFLFSLPLYWLQSTNDGFFFAFLTWLQLFRKFAYRFQTASKDGIIRSSNFATAKWLVHIQLLHDAVPQPVTPLKKNKVIL